MRELAFVECECGCGHRARLDRGDVTARTGAELDLASAVALVEKLRCTRCGQQVGKLYDDTGRLLYDRDNVVRCEACRSVIPLPRIAAVPGTRLCTACASDGEVPPVAPPHPMPPSSQAICPRCGSATVMRQNEQDRSWFVGCQSFPECRWTAEPET
jgi:ssDNA-binding Zn-finger/Zn-ribbon topoisomerase 1